MNIVRQRCSWPPPDCVDFSIHNIPSNSSSSTHTTASVHSSITTANILDITSLASNSTSSTFIPLPSDHSPHSNESPVALSNKRRKRNFKWPVEDKEDIRFIINYKGQCEILEFSNAQWEYVDVQQATVAARKARVRDRSRVAEKQSSSLSFSSTAAALILDDNGRPHNTRNRVGTSKSPMLTASRAVPLRSSNSPQPPASRFKRDVKAARSQSPPGAVPMRRSGFKAVSEMGTSSVRAPVNVPSSSLASTSVAPSTAEVVAKPPSTAKAPSPVVAEPTPLLLQPTRLPLSQPIQHAIVIPPTMAGYDNLPKSMSPQIALVPMPSALPNMQIPSVFQQSPISSTFTATLAPEPSSNDDLYTSDVPLPRVKSPVPTLADQKRTRSTRKAFPGEMTIVIPNPTQTAAVVNVRTTKKDRSA